MRIAFVSSGNSVHVKKLANGLVKQGHEITLYTLPNHNRLANAFNNRVNIVFLPIGGKIGYYLNAPFLRRLLKKGKYDLINSHYVSGYGTLARIANVHPLVTAVFGSDVYKYPYQSNNNMRRVIKNLDTAKVITSTSKVMEDAVRNFYKRDKPIYITPFGVDIDIFKPLDDIKDTTTFVFGIVKKLEDTYGIHYLIEAFSILLNSIGTENRNKVYLSIFGTGSKEDEYKKLVEKFGISDRVKFNGFIKNELVPHAFNSMNVACFPSESESFGVAAVEAMSCGIPVITSDASGFTEVVEDSKCGYIVPKKDIDALANKMEEMFYMDREKLEEMGNFGYQRIRKLYNFENNLKTYIEAISKAIEV
ncbi:glycosyltransferase [Schinkia azotoformans]|uniref:glycosyltransferase n=1 Tax=Schinkia azotoformans TaxID=1454 RepID=UPI002DBA0ADF|nr:glycosyltransferase [Schinkia azotoformans]MEC1719114.1 glycosyltransferase [Schinkia azotoformans]MED4413838.1 glycosyltransferase [Schinkia azotoformans]